MGAASPADAPRRRVGDRLEEAIEHRADTAGELARGERALEAEPAKRGAALRRTIFWLVVSGVSLYLVAPSVIAAFGSWRQIERLSIAWLAAMAALQAAALACIWVLQFLALRGARWQPVIASQLAGNALAKVAPGGGAMGGALQYRMLVQAGLPAPRRRVGPHGHQPARCSPWSWRCRCSRSRRSCAAASNATS